MGSATHINKENFAISKILAGDLQGILGVSHFPLLHYVLFTFLENPHNLSSFLLPSVLPINQ